MEANAVDEEFPSNVDSDLRSASSSREILGTSPTLISWTHVSIRIGIFLLGAILAPILYSGFILLNSGFMTNNPFIVNKEQCSCDCWDGNFRGHHNRGGYKAFYFNYEFETLYSAIVFAIGICLFKDYVQRLCTLSMKRAIRTPCFIGTIALIQPIWYGSWVIVNYYNEFIYKSTSHSGYFAGMYRAQIFFLLTEVIVAFIFALNMDSTRIVHEESMFLALFFSIMHILLAVREKVLWGLIWPGESNVGRDVLFVSTDLISILCSSIILWFGSGCSYPWWNICGGLRSQFQYRSLPFQESQRPIRSEPWFRPAVVACVLIVCYFLFLRFEPPERVV